MIFLLSKRKKNFEGKKSFFSFFFVSLLNIVSFPSNRNRFLS